MGAAWRGLTVFPCRICHIEISSNKELIPRVEPSHPQEITPAVSSRVRLDIYRHYHERASRSYLKTPRENLLWFRSEVCVVYLSVCQWLSFKARLLYTAASSSSVSRLYTMLCLRIPLDPRILGPVPIVSWSRRALGPFSKVRWHSDSLAKLARRRVSWLGYVWYGSVWSVFGAKDFSKRLDSGDLGFNTVEYVI